MNMVEQGDVVRVSGIKYEMIIVSNNYFNRSGRVIACPIVRQAEAGPLHLFLETAQTKGYILCEQVHYIDLRNRHYSKTDTTEYFFAMDLSDAIMGIFDYQGLGTNFFE